LLVNLFARLREKRQVLPAYIGLVVLGMAVVYMPLLAGQRQLYVSDHTFYFQPFAHFIGENLRNLHLPLWNPYLFAGMSQIAVPSPGLFYFPNWIFALLDYSQAMASLMIFHQLIALIGTFVLVESLGWGLSSACAASLIVGLSGYMFALSTNYTLVATASWLPILLWTLRQIAVSLEKRDRRLVHWQVVACAFAFALMAVAGRPEIAAPACAFALVAVVKIAFKHSQAFLLFFYSLLAIALGLLLAMPVIMPVLEWYQVSPRAHGLNLGQVLMWSTNWYDLVLMAFSQPLGDMHILGAPFLSVVATRQLYMPFVTSTYIGPVAITLAVYGLFDRSWRWRWLAITGLSVALIFCLGEYTPVAPYLVKTFQFLAILRYPVKGMFFVIFVIAFAAARGMQCLLGGNTSSVSWLVSWLLWVLALLAAIAFECLHLNKISIHQWHILLPWQMDGMLAPSFFAGAIIGFSSCAIATLIRQNRIAKTTASALLLLLLSGSLLVSAYRFQATNTSNDFYSHPSAIETLIQSYIKDQSKTGADKKKLLAPRLLTLYFDPLKVPSDYLWKPGAERNTSFFQYARELMLPNTNIDWHYPVTFGYEAGETGLYRSTFLDVMHRCSMARPANAQLDDKDEIDYPLLRFCQSTATRFVTSQMEKTDRHVPRLNDKYFDLKVENKELNVRLYQVRYPLPRAYFSGYWRWTDTDDTLKEALVSPTLAGFNPEQVTVVVKPKVVLSKYELQSLPNAPVIGLPPDTAPEPTAQIVRAIESNQTGQPHGVDTNAVEIMLDQPEHIALSVNAKTDGFVVLADHFYPGWTAVVDSLPRPIYKANAEMKAVWIPKGSHLIEFNYAPESLKNGCIMSLSALTLLLAIALEASGPFLLKVLKMMAGQA
jgi:hypothetical protein